MTRTLPTRFAVRSLTGLLTLSLFIAAVAGLSLASDPDTKPPIAKASDKPARPPEEEETNPQPVKNHRVTVPNGDEATPKPSSTPSPVVLKQAALDAKRAPIKILFQRLANPHDTLFRQHGPESSIDIAPIHELARNNAEAISEPFVVTPLRAESNWRISEDPIEVKKYHVQYVKPFEEIALDEVDAFRKGEKFYKNSDDPKERMTPYEQIVAADQALSAVLSGLKSDRTTQIRVGANWQTIEDKLDKRLFEVQLEELNLLVKEDLWDSAFALTKRLAETHSAPGEQKIIAQPLADLILADLKRNPKEKKKFEERLRQMQERFPDNEALDAPAKEFQAQADPLIAKVKKELESAGPKNIESIGKLLNEAEEAAPNNTEVRDLRLQLNDQHPTLRVGVRELPSQMSPALARGDSDLRAVELMFESLVNLHSDDKGGSRWEPGLAEGPPRMIPRGRQFQLALNGKWSNGKRIWAGDVRETVSLLKEGKMASRPPVWGDLLEPVSVGEASRVNLRLLQGWLDPLALMNFKIVPSGSAPESPAFAAHPIGSGPFKCKTDQETDEDDGRKCKIFVANPNYVSRPGKTALPHIEEIHFILYNDAVKEMKHRISNRCDMMLDLTAQDEANLQKAADALHIRLPAPAVVNRRIYFLAVNNRRFGLANPAFRLALASAIDRDTLLDKYFRAGQPLHTALNGPYPAKSWACNPNFTQTKDNKQTLDPFNVVKAKANMALAGKDGIQNPILKLEYPEGDPAVKRAIEELCEKVNASISVTLKPVGVPDAELRRDVETTYSYDLAYYHYDFPDDVYWLGPLLEPRGGPGGQNYLGYNGDLIGLVRDATQCRDFLEVRKYTYLLHDKFLNEEMPFIPLWQLDALSAVSSRVEIPPANLPFDPVRVFTDVEQWKLNSK